MNSELQNGIRSKPITLLEIVDLNYQLSFTPVYQRHVICSSGGTENDGHEIDGHENAGHVSGVCMNRPTWNRLRFSIAPL